MMLKLIAVGFLVDSCPLQPEVKVQQHYMTAEYMTAA